MVDQNRRSAEWTGCCMSAAGTACKGYQQEEDVTVQ
jgi:hypothetical protein